MQTPNSTSDQTQTLGGPVVYFHKSSQQFSSILNFDKLLCYTETQELFSITVVFQGINKVVTKERDY